MNRSTLIRQSQSIFRILSAISAGSQCLDSRGYARLDLLMLFITECGIAICAPYGSFL